LNFLLNPHWKAIYPIDFEIHIGYLSEGSASFDRFHSGGENILVAAGDLLQLLQRLSNFGIIPLALIPP